MIGIFDYGVGNIKSIENALSKIGVRHARITENSNGQFDKVIIPGVGAFPNCVKEFNSRGYRQILCDHISRGGGVLGICVGHQMLFASSEEFKLTQGLSIFDGVVERLDKNIEKFSEPLPNINWLPLKVSKSQDTPMWIKAFDGHVFYFIHSFAAGSCSKNSRATAEYNGVEFCAIASSNNIVGVQFHPEKSGEIGLMFLKAFSMEER